MNKTHMEDIENNRIQINEQIVIIVLEMNSKGKTWIMT